jgi:hypothetical protein
MVDAATGGRFNKIHLLSGIGVRWQSIIVSPKPLEWMKPPDVGTDPRFAWWRKLREVNCSWVSSRGESERFLYYDGPTLGASVVQAEVNDGRLRVSTLESGGGQRQGMFVNVGERGIALQLIEHSDKTKQFDVSPAHLHTMQQAEVQFLKLLTERGLTTSEATGVLESWRPAFFQTPGQRFLSLMSRQDYDNACPMQIRPEPTEIVRVGIVWTEFKQ